MQPSFVAPAVERVLQKFSCQNCGERTARVDPSLADDKFIECWKCRASMSYTVGEFRADVHRIGKAQIEYILMSPVIETPEAK